MKFQLSHSPRRRSTKDRASRKHENPRVEKQTRISFLLFLDGHQTDREARQLPDACFVRCCNGFKLHMTIFRFLLLDFWLLRFRSSCLIIVMMHSWVSCVKWSFLEQMQRRTSEVWAFGLQNHDKLRHSISWSEDIKSKKLRRCSTMHQTGRRMVSGRSYRRSGNGFFMWRRFCWSLLDTIWIKVDEWNCG